MGIATAFEFTKFDEDELSIFNDIESGLYIMYQYGDVSIVSTSKKIRYSRTVNELGTMEDYKEVRIGKHIVLARSSIKHRHV
jgi:hypothetical protein